ncbi:MAG: hypothetical protein ACOC2Q_04610, partial [Spirochaetota bacterium]
GELSLRCTGGNVRATAAAATGPIGDGGDAAAAAVAPVELEAPITETRLAGGAAGFVLREGSMSVSSFAVTPA